MPPAALIVANSAMRTTMPAITLGTRQPMPLSPKMVIEPAISSLPSGGCSEFGSRYFSPSA